MENEKFQELVLKKFEQIDKRFEQIDGKFEQVFNQLNVLSQSMDLLAANQEQMQVDITYIRQNQMLLEQDHSKKISALFDFRDTQLDLNKKIIKRLDHLEAK